MKKYFIVGDTHSFYSLLLKSLNEKGFDLDNPDHIFVLCGDLFDRGDETVDLLKFIRRIPKERRILIRGNHEYLLRKLIDKELPDYYDITNGTVKTVLALVSNVNNEDFGWLNPDDFCIEYYFAYGNDDRYRDTIDTLKKLWKKICKTFKKFSLIDWMFNEGEFKDSNEWIDYLELDNYILVHSTIPKTKDWRENTTKTDWLEASWPCPYEFYDSGFFSEEESKGKILVCGHWHTSDFHTRYENKKEYEDFNIYYGEHLIAIDGCTAYSKLVNVLVIEEDENHNYNIIK